MNEHIEWFEAVLNVAISIFSTPRFWKSVNGLRKTTYREVVGENDKSSKYNIWGKSNHYACLDATYQTTSTWLLFLQNGALDRPFTQFGGWKGLSHGGFLPTGETAVFIIAGDDPVKRCNVIRMFQRDYWFYTSNILRLEGANDGEPFLSGQLRVSDEFLSLVLR